MIFADWSEALPFAIKIGKAYARKFPIGLDVESAIMESLWRSQQRGAEFTKGYVYLRTIGAIKDEARRMAEGGRGTYQDVGAFVDADEQWDLAADAQFEPEDLDRHRLLEAMPAAAVTLVRHLADGDSQAQMAEHYRVSQARISQVLTDLKSRPTRPRQLPRHVDFYAELRRYHREEMRRLSRGAVTCPELHKALGASSGSAWNWATGYVGLPSTRAPSLKPSPLRDAIRVRALRLVGEAFRSSDGRFKDAARLLTVSPMTAYRWSRLLPAGAMGVVPNRSKRRPELPDAAFAALRAQGLSLRAIARRLGVDKATVTYRLNRARPIRKCADSLAEAAG